MSVIYKCNIKKIIKYKKSIITRMASRYNGVQAMARSLSWALSMSLKLDMCVQCECDK